jgi:hypothetical protein
MLIEQARGLTIVIVNLLGPPRSWSQLSSASIRSAVAVVLAIAYPLTADPRTDSTLTVNVGGICVCVLGSLSLSLSPNNKQKTTTHFWRRGGDGGGGGGGGAHAY